MSPKVTIVVLNWNRYEYTKECVESLERITYPNYEIVIVDNGSTDGSAQKLVAAFARHTVLLNGTNQGFARGCNAGIRRALANHTDYVLLMNNDSVVQSGFLEPAVERMESDPTVGLVTGKIYFRDNPNRIWCAGGTVSWWKGSVRMTGYGQEDEGQFDQPGEIRFATGALMLIRRSTIDSVGLLPEEYFFGQEDWDYCTTIRRSGHRLYYVPAFVSYHKSQGSHSSKGAEYTYSFHRGRLLFLQKHLPRPCFTAWMLLFKLYSLVFVRWRLAHQGKNALAESAFAVRCATRDHRRSPYGPVTEQDLHRFEMQLKDRFVSRPGGRRAANASV